MEVSGTQITLSRWFWSGWDQRSTTCLCSESGGEADVPEECLWTFSVNRIWDLHPDPEMTQDEWRVKMMMMKNTQVVQGCTWLDGDRCVGVDVVLGSVCQRVDDGNDERSWNCSCCHDDSCLPVNQLINQSIKSVVEEVLLVISTSCFFSSTCICSFSSSTASNWIWWSNKYWCFILDEAALRT